MHSYQYTGKFSSGVFQNSRAFVTQYLYQFNASHDYFNYITVILLLLLSVVLLLWNEG